MVLRAISDDYENMDQVILRDVAKNGAKLGLAVGRSDIVDALAGPDRGRTGQGLFLASTKELQGMPPLDVVEEYFKTYFYITKKGMDLHLSDDMWAAFDDDDDED